MKSSKPVAWFYELLSGETYRIETLCINESFSSEEANRALAESHIQEVQLNVFYHVRDISYNCWRTYMLIKVTFAL